MNDRDASLSHQNLNAVLIAVAAALAFWLWFMHSNHASLLSRASFESVKLSKMEKRKVVLDALRQQMKTSEPEKIEVVEEGRPLIEVLEETAFQRRVKLNNISPRQPMRTVKKVLSGTRTTTEYQTWVQIGDATLQDLVLFLHEIENKVPVYFVKELSGLSANQGKGDSWRVRVILSRVEVEDG
ncbi:MAG: hypothetical protein QF473_28180 [Planctomycetota bacterium]|jgi:hypothetical protein|nr:hypothetical protein [Planctomycetota bacterium]